MESQVFKDRLSCLLYKYSVNKSELATEVPAHVLAKLMRNDIRVTTKYYVHTDAQMLLDEVNKAIK